MKKRIISNKEKEEIKRLYLEELKNSKEISKIFNYSKKRILGLLKSEGINISISHRKKLLFSQGKIINAKKINFSEKQIKEMIRLYKKNLLSTEEIGKIFNCSYVTIAKNLRNNGVDISLSRRKKLLFSQGKIIPWNKGLTKETDERVLNNVSKNSKKTQFKKGQESMIKGKTWEEAYGREKAEKIKQKLSKTKKELFRGGEIIPWNKGKDFMKGEKNPRWLGGKSFEPYGIDFNKKLKNLVRQRDNQICMNCGVHREKLKEALSIHHINYDKNCNISQNLISLCKICHLYTNHNRKHWTKFFQSLLNERYGYNYENGEIVLSLEHGK